MKKKLTLGILITTMSKGIDRVKKELLPQLSGVDENNYFSSSKLQKKILFLKI
ncbi:MAG: hypothetical protein Q9M97_06425 [Candidatus Gracilibacteria bacterium]|nr:hypothetical protein [Candidatus Gracilibacteria bacterium]